MMIQLGETYTAPCYCVNEFILYYACFFFLYKHRYVLANNLGTSTPVIRCSVQSGFFFCKVADATENFERHAIPFSDFLFIEGEPVQLIIRKENVFIYKKRHSISYLESSKNSFFSDKFHLQFAWKENLLSPSIVLLPHLVSRPNECFWYQISRVLFFHDPIQSNLEHICLAQVSLGSL